MPTNSSLGTTHTTQADSITIQIDNPCYEYFINVSAWNDVGQGKTASTSATLYQGIQSSFSSQYLLTYYNELFNCGFLSFSVSPMHVEYENYTVLNLIAYHASITCL